MFFARLRLAGFCISVLADGLALFAKASQLQAVDEHTARTKTPGLPFLLAEAALRLCHEKAMPEKGASAPSLIFDSYWPYILVPPHTWFHGLC